MNRFLRGHITNFIAGFLLAIISLYYVNSTMFSHVHVIEGATIVHSHFFCDGHTQGGEEGEEDAHTEAELTLIQHLNNIILLKSEFIYTAEITPCEGDTLYIPSLITLASHDVIDLSSPRAPPVAA